MVFQAGKFLGSVNFQVVPQLSGGTRHLFARYLCFQSCGTTGKKQKLLGRWFNRRDFFLSARLEVTKNHHPKKVTKNCQFGHFVWQQGFFLVEELEKPVVSKVKGAGFLVGFGGGRVGQRHGIFCFFLRKETINSAWWMNDEWIFVERKC